MSDRILLTNMQFQGRHGYYDHELLAPQPFEVDVELLLNLQPAGIDDDLEQSVDYGKVYDAVRQIVESTSYHLLEALAEAISHELLAEFDCARAEPRMTVDSEAIFALAAHSGSAPASTSFSSPRRARRSK